MRILVVVVFLFICTTAHAWNARGHMIIAAIAYQEFSAEQKQTITAILIQHPEKTMPGNRI